MGTGVHIELRTATGMLSVLLLGLMAGLMLGTGMAASTAKGLPEAAWTKRFQLEDALFAKVMPPMMLAALAVTVVSCFLSDGGGRRLYVAAAGLMVVTLAITIAREFPLNKEIQSWTAGNAPAHWSNVRDRWLVNHRLRTITAIGAFACSIFGLVRS